MRGKKLEAWRVPSVWKDLNDGALKDAEDSRVVTKQESLQKATLAVLEEIARDVRGGLLETVGVESRFAIDDETRCAVILDLPEGADAELVARAVDLENVEAWLDSEGKVSVGISPWLSTKDVDQTVLCVIKVIHVLLGIHAADNAAPKSLSQKFIAAVMDVMTAQKVDN